MLARDIFTRLKRATDQVAKIELDTTEFGGSRTRMDDNVGGNVIEDLATMLRTNPAFKSWYLGLQKRAREESDIDAKRRFELMLMYPFKYYASTLTGKAKADWEGMRGTTRESSYDITRGGEADDDASFADLGHGKATDKYISSRQREEIFRNKTPLSTSYKYTLPSEGRYATKHEQNPADNVMTAQFLTKLVREANKHYDPKVLTTLLAMLLRWGINLPTYVNRRDVPKQWWQMVRVARDNGGIYNATKNMRWFLSNFGIGKFNNDGPQMREIRNIMMRITDSKDADEVFRTLTSPQRDNQYGGMGKAKDYFAIDVYAKRMGEMNESITTRAQAIDMLLDINEDNSSFQNLFAPAIIELMAILSKDSTSEVN